MKKEIICIICPKGCVINVDGDGDKINSVEGYTCKRGLEYATAEFTNPVRILTTTVKAGEDLLPVRSEKPVPKDKILDCMEVIRKTSVKLPVKMYDIVIENICDTGINIVASKDM